MDTMLKAVLKYRNGRMGKVNLVVLETRFYLYRTVLNNYLTFDNQLSLTFEFCTQESSDNRMTLI